MSAEPMPLSEEDDDVEFGDSVEINLAVGGISQARWERARNDIDARDVLFMLHGRRGSPMSCPFHGRDSKPSFYYFHQNNTCFCWGCPDGDGYWDTIKIVSRSLEITKPQALHWLESEFNLPPLKDDVVAVDLDACEGLEVVGEEEDAQASMPLLAVSDLREPYIAQVHRLVHPQIGTSDARPLTQELAARYYQAKHDNDPLPLARVIGAEGVRHLLKSQPTS